MRLLRSFHLAVVLAISFGCANPRTAVISGKNMSVLYEKAMASGAFSAEEKNLLEEYHARFQRGDVEFSPIGKTICDLIEDERSWRLGQEASREFEKQRAARKEARGQTEATANAMRRATRLESLQSAVVFSKIDASTTFQFESPRHTTLLSFRCKNVSGKKIRFFKGIVFLEDRSGAQVASAQFTVNEAVENGAILTKLASFQYKRDIGLKDMQVIWLMQLVDFQDGTVLDAASE